MLLLKSFGVYFSELIRIELLNIMDSLKTTRKKEYPAVREDWRGKPTPLAQASQQPLNWSPCLVLPLSYLASKNCGESFPKCICEPPPRAPHGPQWTSLCHGIMIQDLSVRLLQDSSTPSHSMHKLHSVLHGSPNTPCISGEILPSSMLNFNGTSSTRLSLVLP